MLITCQEVVKKRPAASNRVLTEPPLGTDTHPNENGYESLVQLTAHQVKPDQQLERLQTLC